MVITCERAIGPVDANANCAGAERRRPSDYFEPQAYQLAMKAKDLQYASILALLQGIASRKWPGSH